MKFALSLGCGAFLVIFSRGLIQALAVMAMAPLLLQPMNSLLGSSSTDRRLLFLRAVLGYTGIGFNFAALERIPLGDAAAINFMSPAFSILLAWAWLGERIGVLEGSAAASSCLGIVLVARPPSLFGDSISRPDPMGVILALCAAVGAGT